MRPLGDITGDLETLLFEMCHEHDLQKGEVLSLVANWIDIHMPDSVEQFTVDDSYAVMLYGHKDDVKKRAAKL